MKISSIVAVDEGFGIGYKGDLPWKIPRDLAHVKRITTGKAILMGRSTYASLPKPLPNRLNVVLTSHSDSIRDGFYAVSSFESAIQLAQSEGYMELVLFGGQSIYEQFLVQASVLYLTVIHGNLPADTKFPSLSAEAWRLDEYSFVSHDENNHFDQTYLVLHSSQSSNNGLLISNWHDIKSQWLVPLGC